MNRVASRANWLSGIFTPEISLTIMLDLPPVAGKVPNSLPFRSGRGDRHCCDAKLEIAQLMPIGRERFLFRFPKTPHKPDLPHAGPPTARRRLRRTDPSPE